MLNRWTETPDSPVDQLVVQSRLTGLEESLVLWGGGNNSVKAATTDLLGGPIDVMYIKSSGSDMKSIVPRQFPAVRLDYIAPLRTRDGDMTDQEMVDYLARCLVDPSGARPSIETLLHAFLPERAILHTHADAILSLTNTTGREETVRRCFGAGIIIVPYRRPGFQLSRDVAALYDAQPDARGLVLMNHGLITWGRTVEEAYARHIELVTEAEKFLEALASTAKTDSQLATPSSGDRTHSATPAVESLALSIRKALGGGILELDQSPETLSFLQRPDLDRVIGIGPATPDHLLYTRRYPILLDGDVAEAVESFCRISEKHYAEHSSDFPMLDPRPRIMLAPGIGMWTSGRDARAARIIRDIYRHTIAIITAAESAGGYATLDDRDAFDAEYWPLELYKLTLLPKPKEMASRIVLVTGAASGIGRAVAERFAAEDAHVVVTDVDLSRAEETASAIIAKHGLRRALALPLDVTDEESVQRAFDGTVRAYGGLDVLVSNAGISSFGRLESLSATDWDRSFAVNTRGHFLVARAAMRIMKQQGTGGSIVFNASKNVTAPGKEFGAYSVSKAAEAQLCRIVALEGGEHGIRANMVNPDAIFGDSRFWSEEMRAMRADAYSIAPDDLPAFYRRRTLLGVEVTAEDVAESVLFLAGSRSGKTTGAMIPVDGGVKEAFPR